MSLVSNFGKYIMLLHKNYFWIAICFLYSVALIVIKFNYIKSEEFWFGIFASLISIFILRAIILKKTISLSVYDLRYPEHFWLRSIWCLIAVSWLITYPFLNI